MNPDPSELVEIDPFDIISSLRAQLDQAAFNLAVANARIAKLGRERPVPPSAE